MYNLTYTIMFNILSNLLFVFTFQKNNFYKKYDNSEYSIIPLLSLYMYSSKSILKNFKIHVKFSI